MTVFANDEAMVSWFQKLLGYLITGEVDERLFFVLVGITHTTHHINGKGIVGNLISCLLNAMVSKLDVRFVPRDMSNTPVLIVTYEYGYPFIDNEAEEWRFS